MKIREHTNHGWKCGCPGDTYQEKIDYLESEGKPEEAARLKRWMQRMINLILFVDVSYQHKDLPSWVIRKSTDKNTDGS